VSHLQAFNFRRGFGPRAGSPAPPRRRRGSPWFRVCLGGLGLSLLLAGCQASRRITSRPDTLVLSTTSDPKTFNSILAQESSSTAVTAYLFEGLTRMNGVTAEVEPGLAESWQVSPDGRVWEFKLRPARWMDGRPVSADDVVFTFRDLIYNPEVPTSSRDVFLIAGRPIKVEKVAEDRVRFILPAPFAPFLRQLGQEILPRHRLLPALQAGRFNTAWGVDTPPEALIGNGLFSLREYRIGERLVFQANPGYWMKDAQGRALPYLKRVVMLVVPDQNAELLKFLQGEVDAISVRGQDYRLLKPQERRRNFTLYNAGPTLGNSFLVFNQNPDAPIRPEKLRWFQDRRFRQAVSYALDRESITRNVFAGLAYPQWGPLNPGNGYFYNERVRKYPYDPELSRRLLAEAGFRWKDGTLQDRDGRPVEFTLLTNGDNQQRVQTSTIIMDDLARLGIKVHFLPVDFNNLVTRLNTSFEWETVLIGFTGTIDPHGGRNVWHSSGQLHVWNPRQPKPRTVWEREIDDLFERGAVEMDPGRRKAIYDRWQEVAAEEQPLIFTVNPAALYAVRNRFGNLKPTIYGVFHNLEAIYTLD